MYVSIPLEEFTLSKAEDVVVIPGGPAVNLVTEVADTGVAGRIVAADACCAVGRTIIGDDELEIAKGLSDDGVERFLAGTLDSIVAQSFRDFELIISDNGSTDRTASICRDYASRDSRIRYFRHEVNRGAA